MRDEVLAGLLGRAGGGHGFSGGGGSSSGGGGGGFGHFGGGGGFFFFGGGSGGGGSAGGLVFVVLLVIVVVVMLMGFRSFRSRLRRGSGWGMTGGAGAPPTPGTGDWSHSDQPAMASVRGDLFPGTATQEARPETAEAGLASIEAHDPAFNREIFLEQVQRTFFVVQEAWSQRKPEMSRQVMADSLWQQHRVQIQGYIDAQKRNVLEDLAVGGLTIIGAHSDANYDTVTVRVLAACADYDVDDRTGRVIRGDRRVGNWSEDWTFQRSSKAVTPAAGGTMTARCPNCGAPLDLDLAGVCRYCKAPVSSGSYDWVLARIAQVPPAY